jgi:hypothetical protein
MIIHTLLTTDVSSTLVGIATRWHKFKGMDLDGLSDLIGNSRLESALIRGGKLWKLHFVSTAAVLALGLAAYLLYLTGGMKNDSR